MSIKTEMLHGVVWSAIEKYSGLLVQLLITAVLARLLTPTDFGVIAIATVITTFFNMFTDMGIGAAIVQNQTLTREDLRSLFSFSVYAGVILAVLFFFSSYLISSFYDNVLLLPICQLLSLNLLFAAWNMVPNALIRKAKRFKFIAVRSFALLVVCGILSVSVALVGGGVYSLLITPILSSLAIFLVNYRQYPIKFSLSVRKKSLAKVFSFSIFQFLFSFVNYFSRNLDKLILGKYYSMSDLGYYEKSYRLMLLPMNYVTNVVTPVMHPILTTLQDDYAQLADKYNKILRLLLAISFPLGGFPLFLCRRHHRGGFRQSVDGSRACVPDSVHLAPPADGIVYHGIHLSGRQPDPLAVLHRLDQYSHHRGGLHLGSHFLSRYPGNGLGMGYHPAHQCARLFLHPLSLGAEAVVAPSAPEFWLSRLVGFHHQRAALPGG